MPDKPYYLNEDVNLDMIIIASKAIPIMQEYSHLMSKLLRINSAKDSSGYLHELLEKEISNELLQEEVDDERLLNLIRQEGYAEHKFHQLDREREHTIDELQKTKMHLVLLNHQGLEHEINGKVTTIETHPSIKKHIHHFLHLHKNKINDEIDKSEFEHNVNDQDLISSLEKYFKNHL